MRLPGWYVVEFLRAEGGCLHFEVKLRRWHPGYWWQLLRFTWRYVRGRRD